MSGTGTWARRGAKIVPLDEFRTGSGVQTTRWGPRDVREDRIRLWEDEVAVIDSDPSARRRALGESVRRVRSSKSQRASSCKVEVNGTDEEDRREK